MAVPDWLEVNVLDMPALVFVIANGVLPEPAVPEVPARCQ